MTTKANTEEMSPTEIFNLEKELQKDSDTLLKEYDILNILSKYGIPHIQGSKKLNVMCSKNVDIFLETKSNLMETWFKLCKTFLQAKGIRRIHPINYYDYDRESNYLEDGNKGFGYFISFSGLKSSQIEDSKNWDFEISIVNEFKEDEIDRLINNWDEKINEEKRESILRIKMYIAPISAELKKSGHGKIKSVEIYKAVLVDNIKTIDEFVDWYNKNETNLERVKAFKTLANISSA